MYYHIKIELIRLPLRKKKCQNFKNVHFEKSCPKIKKHIFSLMTTFSNFTLDRNQLS